MIKHGEAIKNMPVIRSFTTSRVENWPPPDRTRGTHMEPRTAGSDSICIRTQYRSLCFMCNSFAVPLKHCCCRFVFYLVSFFLLLYFSVTPFICPHLPHKWTQFGLRGKKPHTWTLEGNANGVCHEIEFQKREPKKKGHNFAHCCW